MIQAAQWTNPSEILSSCADQFRVDLWADQPCYVEVMVEKQALEGVLEPVCNELYVPFTANKGYSSSSAMYEASKRMRKRIHQDKSVHVIYLGDHDPSGIDMTRDITDRLRMFARTEDSEINIYVHRIALNMPQIEKLRPPENPAKVTDSRAKSYISKFGRSSWELDAIEPRELASLVRKKVLDLRDPKLWKAAKAKEQKMREELKDFAENSKFND